MVTLTKSNNQTAFKGGASPKTSLKFYVATNNKRIHKEQLSQSPTKSHSVKKSFLKTLLTSDLSLINTHRSLAGVVYSFKVEFYCGELELFVKHDDSAFVLTQNNHLVSNQEHIGRLILNKLI